MKLLHFLIGTVVVLVSVTQLKAACSTSSGLTRIETCQKMYQFEMSKILKILGGLRSSQEVEAYCKYYNPIIACLDPLTTDCKFGESALDLTGFEKNSAAKAFKGYCRDKATYLSGISCYNTNNAGLTVCELAYSASLSAAQLSFRATSDFDGFYKQICPAQVEGVKCVLRALSGCSSDVQTVIKNTGYAILHGKCKNSQYTDVTSPYDSGVHHLFPLLSTVFLSATLVTVIICG